MTTTLTDVKWYWEPGDRVYHVYHPRVIGEVLKVTKGDGADSVLVKFNGAGQWFAAYWLRRAK
jgi:hypothetical protein